MNKDISLLHGLQAECSGLQEALGVCFSISVEGEEASSNVCALAQTDRMFLFFLLWRCQVLAA